MYESIAIYIERLKSMLIRRLDELDLWHRDDRDR